MIPALLLPLADFKSVKVPQPEEPPVSNIGPELIGALVLILLILLVFLLLRFWSGARPTAQHPKSAAEPWRKKPKTQGPKPPPAGHDCEVWVLIDGSNVMHWQDKTPSLEPVRIVVHQLRRQGFVPGVVFDANAGWKLFGRYLHDGDFAKLLGIENRQVLVVEKGTQADPFLLQTAREFGARIVTNDRFRDWSADHPEVLDKGFLIRGGIRSDGLWLENLAANPAQASPANAG